MAEQQIEAGEQKTGMRDEHYDLISALYHILQGASTCEQYIQDAEKTGDQELVQFFKDFQEEQRHLAERAKNLLTSRMMNTKAGIGRQAGDISMREERSQTNASVPSGGNRQDDIVDEQSKESFPASDSPGTY